MTNKIEISREIRLLQEASEWIKANSFGGSDAVDLWERIDTSILAAPAVERQDLVDREQWWADTPDGDAALVTRVYPVVQDGYKYRLKGKDRAWTYAKNKPEFENEFDIQPLYASPPAPVAVVLPDERQEPVAWIDGAPSGPWASEWFIAITTHGERVVLRQLPEDYTYDFTTADATYIMRDRIKKWMQFPDSDFVPFSPPAPVAGVPADLAQNAKRYEWIRSQNIGHCEINRVLFETISDDCNPPYRSLKYGKDLDTAIDSCLEKVKEMNK